MISRRFIANGVPAKSKAGGKKSSIEGGVNGAPAELSTVTEGRSVRRVEVLIAFSGVRRT